MKLLTGTFLFEEGKFCAVQVFDVVDISTIDEGYAIGEEYIDNDGDSYIILDDAIANKVLNSKLPEDFFYE